MNILKNKQSKKYSYISRYSGFPLYYNTLDNKYIYGLTSQLKTNVQYFLYTVKENDTLDSLANTYYGRPDFYWVIADFNRIQDPFTNLKERFSTIKIPSIADIKYKE